ncbi:MAG: condensation domain-containing protein, partial [Steroidobacteraceae bacterium]
MSPGQQELLELLLEEKTRRAQQTNPRPRTERVGLAPTSWAQRRLWLIDEFEGGSAGYQVPMSIRLRGELCGESLRRALDALVERHEILRTVFRSVDGEPAQEVSSQGQFALQVVDLREREEAEREAQVRMHKSEEVHERFDLRTGPLIRGRLLRVRSAEHVLLLTMHHIIADGWSKGVLVRELAELYSAFREGRDSALKPLPIQYADYAQWQRHQWSQGETLERQLSYWRERLQGAETQLELPTDRPRPAVQSYRGATVTMMLDAQLSTKLRALARRHEVTLFMVLYAAWAILLSRLSGQEDVLIGSPIANRQRPETEGLIGVFVNTLVLRATVRGDLS